MIENDPESKKAWCNGDKAPYIESELDNELIRCEVLYPREGNVWEILKPRNWPSSAGFYHYYRVEVEPNQTIVFDVDVKLESIENARNTYETSHNWRVIISSPPSPRGLSDAEMKKYGIECTWYGTYTHGPVTIVKKE